MFGWRWRRGGRHRAVPTPRVVTAAPVGGMASVVVAPQAVVPVLQPPWVAPVVPTPPPIPTTATAAAAFATGDEGPTAQVILTFADGHRLELDRDGQPARAMLATATALGYPGAASVAP